MSKVFVSIGISLDGFMAGDNRGTTNPLGDNGRHIHDWVFQRKAFRQHLGMEDGGLTDGNNAIVEGIFDRIGANIMGKNMFAEGEASWPEKAPFGCPVFVLTHEHRDPWVRPGGTTFNFTNDSLEVVLERARVAAKGKDVRISGGASVVQQYMNAGLVDELILHIAPIFLGSGLHVFSHMDTTRNKLELIEAIGTTEVTHIRYAVRR